MPTEIFSRDTVIAISTRPETVFNTASTTLGDYTSVAVDLVYPIPEVEKTNTQGLTALEHPNVFCNGYMAPTNVRLAFTIWDFGISLRLGSRAFNGVITPTTPAAGAYKYSTAEQIKTAGNNLKGTSLAVKNGNYSYLWAGLGVGRFEISQDGGNDPVVAASLLGTGNFTQPSPFTPVQPTPACPTTLTSAILLTDDDGTRDLYSASVYQWNVFFDNRADASGPLVRKGGDPSTAGPAGGTGKYTQKVVRSWPRDIGASILVNADAFTGAGGYWEQMMVNEAITSLQFRVRGALIAGSTYNEMLWTLPTGQWTAAGLEDFNSVLAQRLIYTPKDDGTTGTAGATFAVTNTTATNYD